MAYPNLTKLVRDLNSWNKMLRKPLLSINSPKDRKHIADHLEGELSPENLCCDGELTGAALQRKANFLYAAQDELRQRNLV